MIKADVAPLFTWIDLLNSELIKTEKKSWVGHAGKIPSGQFKSCVEYKDTAGMHVFGPFNTLAEACNEVEKFITQKLGKVEPDEEIKL